METKVKRKPKTAYGAATIAKVKALFIVKGLGPTEISQQTGVTAQLVANWATRWQWVAERKVRIARLQERAIARATDENAGFLDSMASQAEELAEDGMEMARKHVVSADDYAARNFASATQGVKNVVDVYFRARGLDSKAGGTTLNIGSVFVNQIPVQKEEKRVVDLGKVQLPEGSK